MCHKRGEAFKYHHMECFAPQNTKSLTPQDPLCIISTQPTISIYTCSSTSLPFTLCMSPYFFIFHPCYNSTLHYLPHYLFPFQLETITTSVLFTNPVPQLPNTPTPPLVPLKSTNTIVLPPSTTSKNLRSFLCPFSLSSKFFKPSHIAYLSTLSKKLLHHAFHYTKDPKRNKTTSKQTNLISVMEEEMDAFYQKKYL